MSWVNLDDKFPEHPKNFRLSDAAFRIHVAGICYCHRFGTDGLIEGARLPTLVPRFRRQAFAELVDWGMWLRLAGDMEVYEIRDYLDWNDSKAVIDEARERKSKLGRKAAKERWHPQ